MSVLFTAAAMGAFMAVIAVAAQVLRLLEYLATAKPRAHDTLKQDTRPPAAALREEEKDELAIN